MFPTDVENDGACDDDDVSFRLVDARPHIPCALCDLEADERELASVALESTFHDIPTIIDNKNPIEHDRKRNSPRSFLYRSRTLGVSPIFDRRPTDLYNPVASFDLHVS